MLALVLHELGHIGVDEIAEPPPPGHGEVQIRTSYTGICGSDIHGYTGANGRRRPGQVMGHETVGRVEAVGPGVGDLGVGDVVTFNPLLACGRCRACEAGTEQHCPDKLVVGVSPDLVSAFAEKVTVPATNVVPMGDGVDERHGALVEPLAVALHAVHRAGVKAGDSVLVTGGGPIGQSVVLAALRLGAAEVVVTDLSPVRRELCERLGARAVDPTAGSVPRQVLSVLGRQVDVAVDAVGVAATTADALESTRLGGTVGLVGMGAPELAIPAYKVSTEERTIVGSFAYSSRTFGDAAAWVSEGHSVFADLISEVVPLAAAETAFERLANTMDIPGKVLVDLRA